MNLSALVRSLPPALAPANPGVGDDPVIRGIAYDSRAIHPGDLFFALRGADFDGHAYLAQALELGAVALVVEDLPEGIELRGRPALIVPDSRRALAPISTRFFGNPAGELELVGITGTNGKTSTSYLVESVLREAGRRVGLIGTVEVRFAGERERAVNTTPESYDLQRTLRAMCTRGVEAAVLEVSSHGLALGRVDGCRFSVAAITNVTQDHLDFHGDMETYRDAKLLLFSSHLDTAGTAVVNVDDPAAEHFLRTAESIGARCLRTSLHADVDADVVVETSEIRLDGTTARVRTPIGPLDLNVPLVGEFNLENAIVACGIAISLGIEPSIITDGIAGCPQVPGRIERVEAAASNPTVLVDYAHTPDAVEKLLRSLRPLARGKLITVFGCGGDRDRGKRPLMAEAVARWSDRVVATSDNPRTEDPSEILVDVEAGLDQLRRVEGDALGDAEGTYVVDLDRRVAIERAIRIAAPRDMVVIAGKGHEDYQIIGKERLPFDDVAEARRALRARDTS